MNDKQEVYLRVLNDVQFMSEVIDIVINEADSFAGSVLRERILREREAIRLDKERIDRETLERQIDEEKKQEYKSE